MKIESRRQKLPVLILCSLATTLAISGCGATSEMPETQPIESTNVVALTTTTTVALTTTTTIDPREAARDRLSNWAWDPQRNLGDVFRKSSLPPLENSGLFSDYLKNATEDSLVPVSRVIAPYIYLRGCSDETLNLGHLLSVDQVSLPSGKWVNSMWVKQKGILLALDIFVVVLGSDSLQALQERYDKILRENLHTCEQETNTGYRASPDCITSVIPGRQESCGDKIEPVRYTTEMKWLGTQVPSLATAIDDTTISIESGTPPPIRQSVTSITRKADTQWAQFGSTASVRESLFIFEPGNVALYVSIATTRDKGSRTDLFSEDFFDAITQDIQGDLKWTLES